MKTWRAEGGYQDVPKKRSISAPPPPPAMACYPHPTGWAVPVMPAGFVPAGPVLYGPPMQAVPAPQQTPSAPAPTKPAAPKKEKTNPWAPPKLDPKEGVSYMFDKAENHTNLHIFNKAAPIWTAKYTGEKLQFKIFKVSTNFTVKMVIENTLKASEENCKQWAVTEVTEGGKKWHKGLTIKYDSEEAKGNLTSVGWSAKRGVSQAPVWLVVHKASMA